MKEFTILISYVCMFWNFNKNFVAYRTLNIWQSELYGYGLTCLLIELTGLHVMTMIPSLSKILKVNYKKIWSLF